MMCTAHGLRLLQLSIIHKRPMASFSSLENIGMNEDVDACSGDCIVRGECRARGDQREENNVGVIFRSS